MTPRAKNTLNEQYFKDFFKYFGIVALIAIPVFYFVGKLFG